ncbi:CCR4 [Enterospora canceri]|uniref:poly(A)-specific ribonuclease n=1 Tax=Enterospora canceri TaxID=1081671 RepID=A0A1Y1S4W1_9MICR|nr:CCR4 [Enterospora canceri]
MAEFRKTRRSEVAIEHKQDELTGLEMNFQGLRLVSRDILRLSHLKTLILNNNEIESISAEICRIQTLEVLNLGFNRITRIPPELGRLVHLKELYLNDNLVTEVPMEIGTLYRLESFNITNNPLISPYNTMAKDKSLLRFCRENNTNYKQPNDRAWIDTIMKAESVLETYSVGTFNMLCGFYATQLTYAPSWVINLECRKDILMQTIVAYNLDIVSLQEVDVGVFNSFYKENLSKKLDYDGVMLPKKSYDPNTDGFKKLYGQATFWKRSKFRLVEQINIDLQAKIMGDKRFKYLSDVHTRLTNKTNMGLITVLETTTTSTTIIVANVHLYYNPEFTDVKAIQLMVFFEEVEFVKEKYKNSRVIFLGDFNTLKKTVLYEYVTNRKMDGAVFEPYDYGTLNDGIAHNLRLMDAYDGQEITFTNFTPTFKEVIDYIFYSDGLSLTSVISPVEDEYTAKTIGLPNIHFPSDHILIGAKFTVKKQKN